MKSFGKARPFCAGLRLPVSEMRALAPIRGEPSAGYPVGGSPFLCIWQKRLGLLCRMKLAVLLGHQFDQQADQILRQVCRRVSGGIFPVIMINLT